MLGVQSNMNATIVTVMKLSLKRHFFCAMDWEIYFTKDGIKDQSRSHDMKQECIPVGCLPPACLYSRGGGGGG